MASGKLFFENNYCYQKHCRFADKVKIVADKREKLLHTNLKYTVVLYAMVILNRKIPYRNFQLVRK